MFVPKLVLTFLTTSARNVRSSSVSSSKSFERISPTTKGQDNFIPTVITSPEEETVAFC